jgi:hypothetical protein
VSTIGAVLSIIALIYEYSQYSDTYVERLIAWAVFCLCAFHGAFALVKNLNPRLVRAIDYAYLLTAASGVVVFALNYGEKREEVENRQHRARAAVGIERARTDIKTALADLEKVSCEQATQQALPTYCEAARTLRQKFDVTSPRQTREAVIDTYSTEVVQPTQILDGYTVQAYKRIENEALNFRLAALSLTSAELSLKIHEPLPRDADEPEQIYFLFEWPFILVFAFALRITRTTIEVFDWTAPLPVSTPTIVKPVEEPLPEIGPSPPPWVRRERG